MARLHNPRSWYEVRAVTPGHAELSIYDEIGMFGVTAKDFNDSLVALGPVKNMDLRLNSPGGDVFGGNAIYNMLVRAKQANDMRITVYVDGVAASMASLVAMAGDQIVMPANAMMMIHNPSGGVFGTSKEMKDWAALLDKLAKSMVNVYATKSGQTPETVAEMMDAETWMTAEEAVDLGFADTIEQPVQIAAKFDLRHYAHPPESYGDNPAPAGASPTRKKQMPITETSEAMEARLRAEITADITAKNDAKAKAEAAAAAAVTAAAGTETAAQMEARIRAELEAKNAAATARNNAIAKLGKSFGLTEAKVKAYQDGTADLATIIAELEAAPAQRQAAASIGGAHRGADPAVTGIVANEDISDLLPKINDKDIRARYNHTGAYALKH